MNLSTFFKQNKKQRENTTYPVTSAFTDENGQTAEWTIRPLTSRETENIRDTCMVDVPIKGKPGAYRQKLDAAKYICMLMVNSVVEPDLYNAELQDTYGVKTAEELITEMIDNPGEYNDFAAFIQKFNGFTETMDDKVEEAKN